MHPGDGVVGREGAREEEDQPGRRVRDAAGGHVEHPQEDAEVQQGSSEVARLHQDEHRGAPDQEQWAEILEAALGQHLALLAQVAGQEHDQEDLGQLAGLELQRTDVHPQPGAVHPLPEDGEARQRE